MKKKIAKQNDYTEPKGKERVACENIRFSSLFAAGNVPRETSPSAKSEEKRMFSQAKEREKERDFTKLVEVTGLLHYLRGWKLNNE